MVARLPIDRAQALLIDLMNATLDLKAACDRHDTREAREADPRIDALSVRHIDLHIRVVSAMAGLPLAPDWNPEEAWAESKKAAAAAKSSANPSASPNP